MTWIPFHSGLREGNKRGLPRAVRFVYLELSLLSRDYDGTISLPRGFKSDVDAVHDMLGGNRLEVAKAIAHLTAALDSSDEDDRPMIEFSGPPDARKLSIVSHKKWCRFDKSAERTRRWREKQRKEKPAVGIARDTSRPSRETPNKQTEQTDRTGNREKGDSRSLSLLASDVAPEPASKKPTDHQNVIDHWIQRHSAAKGVKPIVQGGDGKAAKSLLASMPLAEVRNVIDRAYADANFVGFDPTLRAVLRSVNRYRGAETSVGRASHRAPLLQPVPSTGRLWKVGTER
jgi:hypothetical protein